MADKTFICLSFFDSSIIFSSNVLETKSVTQLFKITEKMSEFVVVYMSGSNHHITT